MQTNQSKIIYNYLIAEINKVYLFEEARSITFIILEFYFNLSKTAILINKTITHTIDVELYFQTILQRISNQEPIQYIIQEAPFLDNKFYVNSSVLIPRQETEELVKLIESNHKNQTLKFLNIGSGSGCIEISLAYLLPNTEIWGMDISTNALEVAVKNSKNHLKQIHWKLDNIFSIKEDYPVFDVIISNPPYVLENEKDLMQNNVLNFEPHLALFVPNENPLLFYKEIINFTKTHLTNGGYLYFEINEKFGLEVVNLLQNENFETVELHKDIHSKDRMISARKNTIKV